MWYIPYIILFDIYTYHDSILLVQKGVHAIRYSLAVLFRLKNVFYHKGWFINQRFIITGIIAISTPLFWYNCHTFFYTFKEILKSVIKHLGSNFFIFFQHILFGYRGNYTSLLFIIGSAMWHLLNTTHIKLRCKMHCIYYIALLHIIIIPKKIWKIDTHVYVAFCWWWIYKLQ